ncbi:MAG: dipeptide epimerase [Planctomycetes bacterium]|nr:dipeptide epimerase [Planctomycetota bacterium]
MRRLTVTAERWPIAGGFTIARGSKTHAEVVVVTLEQDGCLGRGECVPYPRYGESVDGVLAALAAARNAIEAGAERAEVPGLLGPRAARNALDCALWDLESRRSGVPVWRRCGLPAPVPVVTAFTLSLGVPEAMATAAAAAVAAGRPLLKLKLGRDGDRERLAAVRAAAPRARLIVDANEGWAPESLPGMLAACAEVGVELVEQPLPAAADEALRGLCRPVPVCADESAHDAAGLAALLGCYDAVNVKLDKTGGLTPALDFAAAARKRGLSVMVGCMVATSLAMAPAQLLAGGAVVADLDGPLLLEKDRQPGIRYEGGTMFPAPRELWG